MKQITVILSALIILILGISSAWALPNCSSSGYFHNCFGIYTWENGEKYVGEWQNGQESGEGTYTYSNGDKYVGKFKDSDFNGQGTFTYGANTKWAGHNYVGEFKNNKRNGQGTYTFANGRKEVGEFKNDVLNGFAITYFANGTIDKQGMFKDNEFLNARALPNCSGPWSTSNWKNCFGSYTWENGSKYVGEHKDGDMHGQGTYTWVNGDKYVGEHNDNNMHGLGTKTWVNGDKYVGDWKNDKRNGHGIFTWADGGKYVGGWKDSNRNGLGTKTWVVGDKYVGDYKDDKKNGHGTYTFASGNKYVGGWKNDKRNGQGTLTFPNGTKWIGAWENSKLNGYAITYYANGTINKEGIFKDDEFIYAKTNTLTTCPTSEYFHNCFGAYTYDDGEKYIGEWQNDERNGHGTYTYANGNKYVGDYKDNKKNGQGTFTWASGAEYVGEFKDDKRNGQGSYSFTNGAEYVGEYKDDNRNGQGTYTYPDGSKEVGTWGNNKLNGYAITYYANGSINKEGIFKNDAFLYAEKPSPKILDKDTQDNKVINASSGSGFAVSPDGYVITNNHVIEGCQEVILHTKEKDIKTRIISFDPQNDLALLKGDFQPKTVFALSNNRPELLQDIYVAGYPFGNAISSSIKVTKGIISSLTGIGNNFSNIQIDAALQSGNSGGPIIDDNGNVIAVAVSKLDAKYMLENFGSIPENTNFGIKSSVVKSMLDSNDVVRPDPNQTEISKTRLGKIISSGTYFISCWMTQAQINLLKSKKVLFDGLK